MLALPHPWLVHSQVVGHTGVSAEHAELTTALSATVAADVSGNIPFACAAGMGPSALSDVCQSVSLTRVSASNALRTTSHTRKGTPMVSLAVDCAFPDAKFDRLVSMSAEF